MNRTVWTLLLSLTLLLSACAQAAPANPTTVSTTPTTDNSMETPYPQPLNPEPVVPPVTNPYPEPEINQPSGNIPELTSEQLYTQKRLNTAFAPQEADRKWVAGPVYLEVDNSQVSLAKSDPAQVELHLSGHLPNPCYQLRVLVHKPDEKNQIVIDVYSVADPEKICIQVLQPLDETITLENLPTGSYTFLLNEQTLGPVKIK